MSDTEGLDLFVQRGIKNIRKKKKENPVVGSNLNTRE